MEAIGNLNRLRRASRGRAGVLCAPVTAHMGNLWVGSDPRGSSFSLAVWQQVDDLMRVHVYEYHTERSATPKQHHFPPFDGTQQKGEHTRMNTFMGRPDLKPTHPNDIQPGLNKIVVATVHYGHQEMIMEKDVPVTMRDGITLYVNVFRPDKPGTFPVIISADAYGKDGNTTTVEKRWSDRNCFLITS